MYMDKKPVLAIIPITPDPRILERLFAALNKRKQAERLWRVRLFAMSAFVSVAALIPVAISLMKAFAASNFDAYMSLVFSDRSVIISSWKEITASLAESLPALTLAAALVLIAAFLWSLRSMVRFSATRIVVFSRAV
jgi:hypothetical protein